MRWLKQKEVDGFSKGRQLKGEKSAFKAQTPLHFLVKWTSNKANTLETAKQDTKLSCYYFLMVTIKKK